MEKCGIREIYILVLSTFYGSKLIAVGHLNRSEYVLKFLCLLFCMGVKLGR